MPRWRNARRAERARTRAGGPRASGRCARARSTIRSSSRCGAATGRSSSWPVRRRTRSSSTSTASRSTTRASSPSSPASGRRSGPTRSSSTATSPASRTSTRRSPRRWARPSRPTARCSARCSSAAMRSAGAMGANDADADRPGAAAHVRRRRPPVHRRSVAPRHPAPRAQADPRDGIRRGRPAPSGGLRPAAGRDVDRELARVRLRRARLQGAPTAAIRPASRTRAGRWRRSRTAEPSLDAAAARRSGHAGETFRAVVG